MKINPEYQKKELLL